MSAAALIWARDEERSKPLSMPGRVTLRTVHCRCVCRRYVLQMVAAVRLREVELRGVRLSYLEVGTGPVAVCLHGFPDSAHTWRHLLPTLAQAGFHAVAPFTRGYYPSSIPPSREYTLEALAEDVNLLHQAVGAGTDAVLVGSDWGAETAYRATSMAPHRWRRVVAMAVPPSSYDTILFADTDQRHRLAYLSTLTRPDAAAVLDHHRRSMVDELWRTWSPGYDCAQDIAWFNDCVPNRAHLQAIVSYYRANAAKSESPADAAACTRPTLYLHGHQDGCIRSDLLDTVTDHLPPGSRMKRIANAGHFLHLERPNYVGRIVVDWLTGSFDEPRTDPTRHPKQT